jgi:hypothetical protein
MSGGYQNDRVAYAIVGDYLAPTGRRTIDAPGFPPGGPAG